MKTTFLPLLAATTVALAAADARPCAAQAAPAASASRADTLVLTLDAAVERALRAGDESRLATAQVEAAEAQIVSARATGLPQLRLASTYSHVMENARAQAVGSIFGQANTYNSNLQLSQTLFQGGRILNASRAARRVGESVRLDAEEVRRDVTVDVQRAYLNAVLAARLVEIQEGNLALAGARVAQVERLQEGGRAARYDVLRARVERANLEPLVIQARNQRELALLELKRQLNVPVEQPLRLATALDGEGVFQAAQAAAAQSLAPSVAPGAAPGAALAPGRAVDAPVTGEAVERRGTVRAARLLAEARRLGVQVARADYLPTINVSATTGYLAFPTGGFFQNVPTRLGRLDAVTCPPGSAEGRLCTEQNGGWFSDRSVNVSLQWPIFDGLRTRAAVEQAQAQARIAELQLAQRREAVAIEIAGARSSLESALALYAAQRQNVAEAEEAFTLAELRFSRGLGTQLEASDAQLARLTAQTNAVRAAFDLYLATAELARAEGRTIPTPPTTATAPSSTPGRAP
jgi:outer membrane protein TolC